MQFDPKALRVDDIVLGDFPTQTGNTAYLLEHQVDEPRATFILRYITFDKGFPASTGMGVLAHIRVTALAEGETELQFVQASIASQDGEQVFTPQTLVGSVTVQPPFTARTLSVQVEASSPDQVTVSDPDDANAIISETVVGQALQIKVNPDTNSTSELEISAPGHLSCTTEDNQDHEITLRAGDVNNDGKIDIQDAAAIGIMAGTHQSGEADLNHDGVVDIYDLIHVGRNYGLSSGKC